MEPTAASPPHVHRVEVSHAHLDELGHLNNARYFEFFEAGRTAWYDEAGLLAACRAAGHPHCDTAVVSIRCDFARECRLGERLTVATWPERIGNKSFAVMQRLLKEGGELSAEAVVTSVVMDLDTRQAIALPRTLSPLFPGAGAAPAPPA